MALFTEKDQISDVLVLIATVFVSSVVNVEHALAMET